MLVLTRKPAETIRIGNDIVIKVIKTARGAVKIGIDAPQDVRVVRGELLEESMAEAADAEPAGLYHGLVSDQFPHVA
ncbi:MAG: carbon storage regulator [Planctomycetaceae bacterium]